jgi:hypothetical protein
MSFLSRYSLALSFSSIADPVRDNLDATVRHFSHLVALSTIAVALGVLMEGVELAHAVVDWRKQKRREKRERIQLEELRQVVPVSEGKKKLPKLHSDEPIWAKLILRVGLILVVIGVVGEWRYGAKLEDAHDAVHRYDLEKIGEANAKSGAAFERAAQTEKEAAEDLKATNIARQKAEEARQKAEGFELQIAQANERASEANRIAESERLARVAIEEKLAGWKLTGKQQANLLDRVKPFPDTPYDLSVNPSETAFMEVLDSILARAGWSRKEPQPPPSPSNALGINVLINKKAAMSILRGEVQVVIPDPLVKDFGKAASELAEGLFAAGINVKGHHALHDNDPTAIHILIGSRQ